MLSVVTPMWDVEMYGFPWRELLCECIRCPEVGEVIVAIPANSGDETLDEVSAWAKREPKLHWLGLPAVETKEHIAAITNEAICAAMGELVLSLQADEVLEMDSLFQARLKHSAPILVREPFLVGFPRWDFTFSASHVEPVWDEEPAVMRLFGRRHFPYTQARDDGMHVDGPGARVIWEDCPIYHYHGLSQYGRWRSKELAFQRELFNMEDPRLLSGDRASFKDRHDRAYPVPRPHPHIMGPWLSRSDLMRRDYQRELKHGKEE